MRVLISGGAGFIGSHLAEALVAAGDDVMAIDNFATARRDNLEAAPTVRLVEVSIADRQAVFDAFEDFRPDVTVHAAASYKDPDNWYEDSLTNAVGTANVVQASRDLGVKRLVYFQTALGYGLHPLEQPITLGHPLRPDASSYAISKTAGEHYVFLSGVEAVSFRLANAYGPRNLSGPLPTFYQRLTGGKPCFVMDTRRDFVFVSDLVEVVTMAVRGLGRPGPYHVSSGSDYSIRDLYDATAAAIGLQPAPEVEVRQRSADDAYTILLDPSETERDFDWAATTPLAKGVAAAVAYYREKGVEHTFTHLKALETRS